MSSKLAELVRRVQDVSEVAHLNLLASSVSGTTLSDLLLLASNNSVASDLVERDGSWFGQGVVLGERVRVLPGSVIFGPAVIGDDAVVGPNALLKDGVILGARAVAGMCCEVKASILADDALSWHFSYIGNSVVCRGARIGAGFVSAVIRHDARAIRVGNTSTESDGKLGVLVGPNTKVGIHVSAMPGTIVPPNSMVPPHSRISGLFGSA